MADITWTEHNSIKVSVPKKPKKLTGTRFATVLGLNPWTTQFATWCEVTKTYVEPFEDTIYTIAGKTIEPKQAEYMKKSYFMKNLVAPASIWGEDYFKVTWGDFFPNEKVFGGMWDYILMGKDGKPDTVLEMKTTKRAEDWAEDIPEYYALQAALYAYLLGIEKVVMVASFLEAKDYEHPEDFVPNNTNTKVFPFNLYERYPNFERDYIVPAKKWWDAYVMTGESPTFDEKKDADILKVLRNKSVDTNGAKDELLAEAEALKAKIDAHAAEIKDDEKRLKVIVDSFKKECGETFNSNPGLKTVEIAGSRYKWVMTRSETQKVDTEKMKEDGIYDKYTTTEVGFRMAAKEIK